MDDRLGAKPSVRVSRLSLHNFRGIVGPTTIDFHRSPGSPTSLIIYGDNGSGKSSIADALEFVTRGVVSRRLIGGIKQRREVNNLSVSSAPTVHINLDNGEGYWRGKSSPSLLVDSPNAVELKRESVIPGFDVSPLVLRRDVIEIFWRISATERLELFWDYFRTPGKHYRTQADIETIESHAKAQQHIRETAKALLALLPKTPDQKRIVLPTRPVALERNRHRILRMAGSNRETVRQALEDYSKAVNEEVSLRASASIANRKVIQNPDMLRRVCLKIAPEVAKSFKLITREEWFTSVEIEVSKNGSLDIFLLPDEKPPLKPENVLSEANLDLLALLVLLHIHIHCAEQGQHRIIVLDDVFQSVDTTLRSHALNEFARLLNDWQIILTVHDRLWLEIAHRCLKDAKVPVETVELRDGGFGKTPTIISTMVGPLRDLRSVLDSGQSSVVVAGVAGRTLEALMDRVSINMRLKVRRNEGDKYSLGQLWNGLDEELKSCDDEELISLIKAGHFTQYLRNELGAHFAEWGDGLANQEALDSAHSVIELWFRFYCSECGRFATIEKGSNGKWRLVFKCHQSKPNKQPQQT